MMRRVALIAITALICHGALCEHELLAEKIRAGYCGVTVDEGHPAKLVEHGFNALWMKMRYDPEYDGEQARWGKLARDAGIAYFEVANTTGGFERNLTGYRRAVSEQGEEWEVACPRDARFWRLVFADRANALLDIAEAEGFEVAGFILDVETYGIRGQYGGAICYCDDCWTSFLAREGVEDAGEVAPDQRMMWLVRRQRYPAYQAWLESEWEAVIRPIAEALRERAPELLLGNFHYQDNTFHRALLRALGAEDLPALVGWEGPTYSGGLIDGAKQAEYYAAIGAHAVDLPGHWVGRMSPEAAAAHCYQLAMNSAGYWLFDSSTLWRDWTQTDPNSAYYLPRPAEEYWAAYAQANAEIGRSLADADYESPLAVDLGSKLAMPAVPSSPEAIAESFAGDRDLVPLRPESGAPPDVTPPTMRCAGVLLAYAEAGETLAGRVKTVRVGTYPTNATWALLAPSGEELAANMAPIGEVSEFSVEAPETGVYTLFLRAGKNGVFAQMDLPQWVLREYLSGTLWVVYEPPPLYFMVPAGTGTFSLTVKPGGGQEGCDLRIFNADGECVLTQVDAMGTFDVQAAEDQRGRPWRIELTKTAAKTFEDVELHLEGCPPCYALSPEALLVPPGSAR